MSKSMSTAEGLRTWQVINQRVPDQALSPAARRTQMARWLGWGTTFGAGFLLLVLVAWAAQARPAPARGASNTLAMPLAKVQFKTDGVLTEDWVMKFLQVNTGDSLEKLDLYALRQKLLATKQVSDATIQRVRPGTLVISLTERHPVLRAAVDNGAGGFKQYLVARDGTVFEGLDFPSILQDKVPWMSGRPLHRTQDGFDPLTGMDAVADLLQTAHNRIPQLAVDWTEIDLSHYDPRPQAGEWSQIRVPQTGGLGQLTFSTTDFAKQIDRLALAAHTVQDKGLLVSGYDLSVRDQVVVRLVAGQTRNLH